MRTLQSELAEKGICKKGRRPKKRRRPKQKVEKLSQRDLEELMGTRRPTYKRNRGAFRQR